MCSKNKADVVEFEGFDEIREERRVSTVPSFGLMVARERLLRDVCIRGAEAGITLVCAPDGMGKTALLLSYVTAVQHDAARGSARLIDVDGMDVERLFTLLKHLPDELPLAMRPLIAIDNMPELGSEALEIFPALLRDMRAQGIELIISCKPVARGLVQVLGDSHKIGSQALVVRPREYPLWAQAFSIDKTLDVYELTQGIPALVVALRSVDGEHGRAMQLERAAVALYESVLKDLSRSRDSLYRLACLLLLVGEGTFALLASSGMRIRDEAISRLMRDYPMFGIDAERQAFACMASGAGSMRELRGRIAKARPAYARKAMQILMTAGAVDRAVQLAASSEMEGARQELVASWPLGFALSGNIRFVNRVVSSLHGESAASASSGLVLAVYADALVTGEFKIARSMASELARRFEGAPCDIAPADMATARALARVWEGCPGIALPDVGTPAGSVHVGGPADRLSRHAEIWHELLLGHALVSNQDATTEFEQALRGPLDVSWALLYCDDVLCRSFFGDVGDVLVCDKRLSSLSHELRNRKLSPLAEYARMAAATARLMAGAPLVDERAFVDAGTAAVRARQLPMQLFCLLGEGWQDLLNGQAVNARFRAQQVLKLADERVGLLVAWATLLERAAYIADAAPFALSVEADAVDLSQEHVAPAEAWATALLLSAAGYESELVAWYSLHKAVLLEATFVPLARQALSAVGDRGDAMRGLIPAYCALRYDTRSAGDLPAHSGLAPREPEIVYCPGAGRIEVKLFGGFRIERNGHLLTERLWRRKRLCSLISRLVLANGAFVERRVITEEMWPESPFPRARENLYSVLSDLRAALGQQPLGPQYILTQGEGIAVNGEYVTSDVAEFDRYSRDVLLRRTGTSGREIIESCLKLEKLYKGALYVADLGDTSFHVQQRRQFEGKFIDCMLRGVEVAMSLEDLPTASWLIEAAKRFAPYREDVVRFAMRLYDRTGRRREVEELYGSHLHYLKHVAHAAPEEETRLAYEAIMGASSMAALL